MAEPLAMEVMNAIDEAARNPQRCPHDWRPCLTPPDSASRWYRCEGCQAFGYRRRGNQIVPYRCYHKGCKAPAVDRIVGRRGPRGAYLWLCNPHRDEETNG